IGEPLCPDGRRNDVDAAALACLALVVAAGERSAQTCEVVDGSKEPRAPEPVANWLARSAIQQVRPFHLAAGTLLGGCREKRRASAHYVTNRVRRRRPKERSRIPHRAHTRRICDRARIRPQMGAAASP